MRSQYTSDAFQNAIRDAVLFKASAAAVIVWQCTDGEFFHHTEEGKIYRISAYKQTCDQVKSIIFRYIFV